MSRTIIINEEITKQSEFKQAVQFSQMPGFIRMPLLKGKLPISNNPALPYDEYLEDIMFKAYKNLPHTNNKANISKLLNSIKELEKPIINNLEQLCAYHVMKFFNINENDIDLKIELLDEIKANVQMHPDENNTVQYDNIKQIKTIKEETCKRKLIDTLIAGAAQHYAKAILDESKVDLDNYNQDLYPKYNEFLEFNQLSLFKESVKITNEDKHQAGISIVYLGNEEKKNQLSVSALIYPILVYETVKGFMEMFAAHGLPQDESISKAVLSKSDYLLAEPWYMRLGPIMWEAFMTNDIHSKAIPQAFMRICQLPCNKFNVFMQEVLAGTRRGDKLLNIIKRDAEKKSQKQEFDLNIDKNYNLINDEYINPNEL